jgi:hypothetical protein
LISVFTLSFDQREEKRKKKEGNTPKKAPGRIFLRPYFFSMRGTKTVQFKKKFIVLSSQRNQECAASSVQVLPPKQKQTQKKPFAFFLQPFAFFLLLEKASSLPREKLFQRSVFE